MSTTMKIFVISLWTMYITKIMAGYNFPRNYGRATTARTHTRRPYGWPPKPWIPTTTSHPVIETPEVLTYQTLTEPLNSVTCRDPRYARLRVCREPADVQNGYSTRWLCNVRDSFTGSDVIARPSSRRNKRSILNPCSGQRIRVAVVVAFDSDGNERELVANLEQQLYQTIVVERCASGTSNSLQCLPHNITFEAAVFDVDPNSLAISLEDVSIQAYCALSSVLG